MDDKFFTHSKFGRVERLTPTNYLTWYTQVQAVLRSINGLGHVQEETIEEEVEVQPENNADLGNVIPAVIEHRTRTVLKDPAPPQTLQKPVQIYRPSRDN